jgi:hypothetical protein
MESLCARGHSRTRSDYIVDEKHPFASYSGAIIHGERVCHIRCALCRRRELRLRFRFPRSTESVDDQRFVEFNRDGVRELLRLVESSISSPVRTQRHRHDDVRLVYIRIRCDAFRECFSEHR